MASDTLISLALTILLLPLAAFAVVIFFGKKLPRQGDWLSSGAIGAALLLAAVVLIGKLSAHADETLEWNFTWVDFRAAVGALSLVLGIAVDNLTAIMLVVVTLISALVHLFSIGYMKGDVRYARYFAYLGLFSFSMLLIVLANNLFLLYVGWELVGISSYLLIGHWYERKSASNAAIKAFVVNRIGDLGFFIGIATLFMTFHTFMLKDIFAGMAAGHLPFDSPWWLTAAGVLLFCGAVGKSAQFPLHVWLPDAMEGPTPVSALIHAATMVAAGVYLVARLFPLFTADALLVIAYIGAITAFIAATIAVAQNDIKKVLAYSTISQLGYMIMALGVGAYTAGFFHLVTHAMFKAGLFLGSGSVIHAMHSALHHENDHHTDAQDIRNMGGLKEKMPITFWTFVAFTLAISGVPLTSGFLSKDEILSGTIAFSALSGHVLIPLTGFLVAGITAFYMFRLLILTFLGTHAEGRRIEHVHESPRVMTLPLLVLASLCFFAFYSVNPFGASSGWIAHAIERPQSVVPAVQAAPARAVFEEALEGSHLLAMALSLSVAGLGILAAFATYYWKRINADAVARALAPLHKFLLNKWYFDELYGLVVVQGMLALASVLRWFDNTIVDGLVNGAGWVTRGGSFLSGKFDTYVVDGLVNASAWVSGFFGLALRKLQTGKIQSYVLFAVLGVMLFYFVFRMI
ncbi:MAG TPA: NADH-quinone oxidoreductase subunit L [Bacteroidota bacterium]|nr:NADH-quinone oxidoreductase subunit L [Bacteroidota bacterium]